MPKQSNESDDAPVVDWPAHLWQSAHTLDLVRELNGRCLGALAKLARGGDERCGLEIVRVNRDLLRTLDASACSRAARSPVLLLDIYFQNDDWWRWARSHHSGQWRGAARLNCLPPKAAGELMRETLTLAWHAARTDYGAASLLLGMSRSVTITMAGLGLQDIEHISAIHFRHLHLRWSNRPHIWRQTLLAARSSDNEALHEMHLYSLQLLGSEIIPRCA